MSGLFITGTDTGVGKTLVCGLLASHVQARGLRVVTQKWVQTGCVDVADDLREHDRFVAGESALDAQDVTRCPYCFPLPASPHLAAAQAGRRIDPERIIAAYHRLLDQYHMVLVEGAGGAMVPLTDDLLTIDLAARLHLPVLVVAANRLGCINHTLLTLEALRHRRIPILGVVMNRMCDDSDPVIAADNPRAIAHLGGAPVLGEMPPVVDMAQAREAFTPIGDAVDARLREESDQQ